jgi:glycerol-3-phosphate dehydrogenase
MIAYDVLSYDKSMKRHHMLSREQTLRLEPGLNASGLLGAAYYYDAQITFPERLTIENALAARDKGAVVLTYCNVDHPLTDDRGNVTGIAFTDRIGGGTYSVHAPITVNVAGPWVDEVLAGRERQRYIGGTKGSHIVVDAFPGAPKEALYVEAAADRRPYFIVPWNGRYLIGTTDIRHSGDFDEVVPDDEEIEYLVNETNRIIPDAHLKRTDILYAYAGVRPLPYKEEGTPGSITRKHVIHVHKAPLNGMISIIGGKITTYRRLAEQTIDAVFKLLKRPAPPSLTGKVPLPGANTFDFDRFTANLTSTSGLEGSVVQRLARIYGVHAKQIIQLAGNDPVLRGSFSPDTGAIGAEIPYAVQSEMAETLVDILMRRTMVGLDASAGRDAVENAVKIAQQTLGWNDERARAELAGYRDYVQYLRPRALPDEVPIR